MPAPLRWGIRSAVHQWTRQRLFFVKLLLGDINPLVNNWPDRGQSIHRVYTEAYLEQHRGDIRGHCLEFQEATYLAKFGTGAVTQQDILHHNTENPLATIVADLTGVNDIPSNTFDCIICTYVLHLVPEVEAMVAELHRILKPGGVLLVAVPNITVHYDEFDEFWRFTGAGMRVLLGRSFGKQQVTTQSFGNAITAMRELYGLGASSCRSKLLTQQDPRYALAVCARAVKA